MNRVDELQKKYPTIPRDMLIKWKVHRNGIRYTEVIDKISYYDRGALYQSRDTDVTLQDIAKKRPQMAKGGFVPHPPNMYTKTGFGARIVRDSQSAYEVREEHHGEYALYEGEEKIADIYFPTPRPWAEEPEKEPWTSKGTPVTSLVRLFSPTCFNITPVRHCEYFATGDQCRFCNINATYEDATKVGAPRPVTINPDETVEAYKIIGSEFRLVEGRLVMGAMADSEKESKTHLQFMERMSNALPYQPHMSISTQPMSRQNMQRLKDAGLHAINMNIEVWDARLFEEVCPGKAKNRGHERYLEAYRDAVEILGWGHVGTNMPPGVTLMAENGHKTWQESRDSHIEGLRWLIKHGVFPIFESLVLGVGSVYGDNLANRKKLPPTDLYLDLAIAHHDACLKYGMYDKMDKLLWCPLDCAPLDYCGQLGMVALAGDIGKWAASVFPGESNWLGRFIDSFRSPAATQ